MFNHHILRKLKDKIERINACRSTENYVRYLRKKGVKIGKDLFISGGIKDKNIDITRPSLITIGDYVSINRNFTLLTHDFVSGVFIHKYNDFLPSSGAVTIGNNVRFGANCTVLKGVTIGDNCFIAAGSIVTRDIPSNSIAAGIPCRVITTIEKYYSKRKDACVAEAFLYAQSIVTRYGRKPVPADFWEEFPLFVDKTNIENYPEIPIKRQLQTAYDEWLTVHEAPYKGFEEFLNAALAYQPCN